MIITVGRYTLSLQICNSFYSFHFTHLRYRFDVLAIQEMGSEGNPLVKVYIYIYNTMIPQT